MKTTGQRQWRFSFTLVQIVVLVTIFVVGPPILDLLPVHYHTPFAIVAFLAFFSLPFWLLIKHARGGLRDPADAVDWWGKL